MLCKIDHTSPDSLPAILCRACRPELHMAASERAALDAADKERARIAYERLHRERELVKAKAKLATCTKHGDPDEGTVNAKIATSMRKKIHRLEQELAQ